MPGQRAPRGRRGRRVTTGKNLMKNVYFIHNTMYSTELYFSSVFEMPQENPRAFLQLVPLLMHRKKIAGRRLKLNWLGVCVIKEDILVICYYNFQ